MKHDLEPIIVDGLRKLYGLERENTNYIYRYICIRTSIFHNKRKINDRDLFKFILDELNLTVFRDNIGLPSHLIYKDEKHSLLDVSTNLLDNLVFRAEMEGNVDYREELEEVFVKGYRKAHKYKQLPSYKSHLMLKRLEVLNQMYGAHPIHTEGIEGFETDFNHNPFKRSLEERLEVAMDASKHGNSNTTSYITEEELEDYLVENLDLIEKGLMLVKRQFSISGGFIDILAKDSKGNMCIIEIKISEDKSIVWQSLHYPNEIKKEYNSNVRMITVSPEYSTPIYNALKSIGNVEMFKYTIGVSNSEISKLTLMKTCMPKEKRSL